MIFIYIDILLVKKINNINIVHVHYSYLYIFLHDKIINSSWCCFAARLPLIKMRHEDMHSLHNTKKQINVEHVSSN